MTQDDYVFLGATLATTLVVAMVIVSIYLSAMSTTHWWWLFPIVGGLALIYLYQALYGGGE